MSEISKLKRSSTAEAGTLSIGEISKKTGIKIVTLRFYEAQGLIPRTSKKKSLHRRYGEGIVDTLKFITAARSVGLSLEEIKGLLEILRGFKLPSVKLMKRLRETATEVEDRINHLKDIRRLLKQALEDPTEPKL